MHKDFTDEEAVKFSIDGQEWSYIPVSGGQENDWLNEYMYIEDSKPKSDFAKLNMLKIRNIKSIPYGPDVINEILGVTVEKGWPVLNEKQKQKFIWKLNKTTYDALYKEITRIDSPSELKKKG